MLEEKQKNLGARIIFIINFFLVIIIVLVLKIQDKDNFSFESNQKTEIVPIDSDILQLQSEIATYRENKLRDLNSSPKEIKQKNITTTVTETVPDRETKTS